MFAASALLETKCRSSSAPQERLFVNNLMTLIGRVGRFANAGEKQTGNLSTLARLAFYLECCADHSGAIMHNSQTHPSMQFAVERKSRAIILDGESKSIVGSFQPD